MNEAKRINNLIHHIQGTCISLEEACNDLGFDREDLTMDELEELDNWVFQCDDCGWWYDCGDRDIAGETYKECLISKIPDYLIDLKLNKYGLNEARAIADKTIAHIDKICAPYTKDSEWNKSNQEIEDLLDWAQGSIIKRSLSNELIQNIDLK